MGKYFGTDGIRGVANTELTPELCMSLGKVAAHVLAKEVRHKPNILIGTDTRLSKDLLEAALSAGFLSMGANVVSAGVIPTPAIAKLVKKMGFDAGVVISASHNPYYDNGIKFFSGSGFKLTDETEKEIEAYLETGLASLPLSKDGEIGAIKTGMELTEAYVSEVLGVLEGVSLSGMKLVLDCANGAAHRAAPMVFERAGANVTVTGCSPDGLNINQGCGSTHISHLSDFVKEYGADAGVAFDGDGDRCFAVDENGDVIDGDMIMSIIANYFKNEGRLAKDTVVATVMSNLGFLNMGGKYGINIEKTKVGDRYVLELMLAEGYNLGGEQSGHIIMLDYNTTGDGILSALMLLKILKLSGKKLSELNTYMKKLPQALVNARIKNENKDKYMTDTEIQRMIAALDLKYAEAGRLLIRPSGTEPLVRVMLEGEDLEEITADASALAGALERKFS